MFIQHQKLANEDDYTMRQEHTKSVLGFLLNRNLSNDLDSGIQKYLQLKLQNEGDSTHLLETYQQVCGKIVGSYKSTQAVDKPNIKLHSLTWLGNGIHCLIAYQQQNQKMQQKYRFDLHLVNSLTKQKEKYFPTQQGTVQGIGGLCTLNDGKNILLGDKQGQLYILDYIVNQQVLYQRQNIQTSIECITQLCSSPDDKKFAISDENKYIHIFDRESEKLEAQDIKAHGQKITSMQYHPFKAMLMSSSEDKQINIWCPQQKERLFQMYHNNIVNKAIWHQNGNWVLSCGKEKNVKLYDIRKHQKEFQIFKCDSEVKSIDWHPTNPSLFVSGESDGTFTQWSVNSTGFLDKNTTINSPVCDVKYNGFGNVLGVLIEDKQLRFFGKGKSDNSIDLSSNQQQYSHGFIPQGQGSHSHYGGQNYN